MSSAPLICLVVGITDGDTPTARCGAEAPQMLTIRLAEVDAPERGQPFAQRSKQHLAGLCFRREARVRPTTTDRYGRTVARVAYAGSDASASMVQVGIAWAITKYLTDPQIAALETHARRKRAGLWVDASPVPPWDWRRQSIGRSSVNRRCQTNPELRLGGFASFQDLVGLATTQVPERIDRRQVLGTWANLPLFPVVDGLGRCADQENATLP